MSLRVGDELVTSAKTVVIVDSIADELELQTVHNIEVADFHTYFVGNSNIYVHNADCGKIEIKFGNAGGNSARWVIDKSGNLLEVSGKLVEDFGGAAKGNLRSLAEEAEQVLAGKSGFPGDQGGHAIAHRFLKDQGSKNLFAQEGNFNMGAYKTLENDYARALQVPGTEVNFSHSFSDFVRSRPNKVTINTEILRNGRFFDAIKEQFNNTVGQIYQRRY